MKGYAVVYVRQYGPDSREGGLRQKSLSYDLDYYLRNSDLSKYVEYNQTHYPLAQSPSTIREGVLTDDGEDWSDSPTNQPDLDDSLRYSYGRFGTRYGKLDSYSGAIIRTQSFLVDNEGASRSKGFYGTGDLYRLNNDTSGWFQLQKFGLPSNYEYVYTYDIFSYSSPVMFSYKNPVNTDVSIRLSNFINSVDAGSVQLFLGGEEKNLTTSTFTGGLGGVDAIWSNDENFDYNEQIDVLWTFTDDAVPANSFEISYWFRTVNDYIGPRISNLSPEDDSIDISVSSCVQFDIRDYEKGINLDTLEIYVNNVLALDTYITTTELSTGDGYRVIYCPPEDFLYGDEVPVSIYVEDNSDEVNYLFHVYSFTTEESSPPEVISTEPVACRKYKSISVNVEADIVDGGHGLDGDTIILHVDNEVVVFRKLPIIYRED